MRKRREHPRLTAGFTLIELLVVIGITAILLAILLPTLSKARRAALVLASPVVYVGNDQAVHLTDPTGGSDLYLARRGSISCPVCHAPPEWSPSGLRIGFTKPGTSTTDYRSALVEPVSGQVKSWASSQQSFIGWIDSDRYLQGNGVPSNLSIIQVYNGQARLLNNATSQFEFISPAPVHAPFPFIGMFYDAPKEADVISFFRKDLGRGKVVWSEVRAGGGTKTQPQSQLFPRVDPLGEFIAWTIWRNKRWYVAIKSVKDSSGRPPTLLGEQYPHSYFCDWTEGGDLLVNVGSGKKWQLVILRRNGSPSRELGTFVAPAEGVVASWRKYEHR